MAVFNTGPRRSALRSNVRSAGASNARPKSTGARSDKPPAPTLVGLPSMHTLSRVLNPCGRLVAVVAFQRIRLNEVTRRRIPKIKQEK